ncbi:hypothetical protein QAD02_016797 [Eretmocerus hayati]|uniref:Uncharacterized protein n=1 Tax=Eretmocerus hayati TaxID=131215 RepID=A0ACC2PBL6_9HYME|nr:hypothetical protein QAD02_016797 [Eretmocerus hayati]
MENSEVAESNEQSAKFWRIIEKEIGPVETFIKNIITVKGFDNREILESKRSEDIFQELEAFVKSGRYTKKISHLLTDSKLQAFYGHCATDPSNFSFKIEHKNKLLEIIKICKNWSPWENAETFAKMLSSLYTKIDNAMLKFDPNHRKGKGSIISTLARFYNLLGGKLDEKDDRYRKYRDALQKYCMYICLTRGDSAYKFLVKPLSIPSIDIIYKSIKTTKPRVDGEFQIKGLKEFLTERNLPPNVWISEAIVKCFQRVQFNYRENEAGGFVRHLDENGMPKPYTFKFNTIQDLNRYIEKEKKASFLYCFMAQPLAVDAPPYCLAIFGCDLSYTSEQCLKRWDTITRLLKQEGITVQGFSAHDYPRLLKAMRVKSKLGEKLPTNETNITGFCAEYMPDQVCVQDPISVVEILMIRLLVYLIGKGPTIGNHDINMNHLRWLVCEYSGMKQEKCLFTREMLSPNSLEIDSLIKICHPETMKLIETTFPNSEGTREYLKLMNLIVHSYMSTDLSPLVRVYCLWYPVFFLRLWYISLRKTRDFAATIQKFIRFECFTCIEINAHSFLSLILNNMSKPDSDQFFLPWQCGIEPCNELFKKLRTPDCQYYYGVDCTPLGALRKVQRIELIDHIMNQNFSIHGEKLNFPGSKPFKVPYQKITSDSLCVNFEGEPMMNQELSLSAVQSVIDRARQDAYQQMLKLGVTNVKIEDCHDICDEMKSDDSFESHEKYNNQMFDEDVVESHNHKDVLIAEQCLDPEERTDFDEVKELNELLKENPNLLKG